MKALSILVLTLMFVSCGKKEENKKSTSNSVSCSSPASVSQFTSTEGQISIFESCSNTKKINDDSEMTISVYESTLDYEIIQGDIRLYTDASKTDYMTFQSRDTSGVYGTWTTTMWEDVGECDYTMKIEADRFTFSGSCR